MRVYGTLRVRVQLLIDRFFNVITRFCEDPRGQTHKRARDGTIKAVIKLVPINPVAVRGALPKLLLRAIEQKRDPCYVGRFLLL